MTVANQLTCKQSELSSVQRDDWLNFTTVATPHFVSTFTQSFPFVLGITTYQRSTLTGITSTTLKPYSVASINKYSMNYLLKPFSFTRWTPSLYRRDESIAKAILPSSFRIERRPDLHHRISTHQLCPPLTNASTFQVKTFAP